MPERSNKSQGSMRWIGIALGIALLIYLVSRAGPQVLWSQVRAVGYSIYVVIAIGGVAHFVKTWAWRKTFTCDISHLSWRTSFGMRLVSEAIGQLGLAGKVIGEGARVSLLGSAVPVENAVSAAALDSGFYFITSLSVALFALVAGLLVAPLPAGFRHYAAIFAGALAVFLLVLVLGVAKGWRLLGPVFKLIGHLPKCNEWVSRKQAAVEQTERNLLNFHRDAPRAFWFALALNFLTHGLALTEIYVILLCLTPRATLFGALILEGLTKLINGVGSLNPGNVGTYEAGNILITKMFGVSAAAGLTLAICRRVRAVFWAVVGVICLMTMRRSDQQPNKGASPGITSSHEGNTMNKLESTEIHKPIARAAIIIANDKHTQGDFSPCLARVGTLPLLLRNILSVKACQAERIVVLASPAFIRAARLALLQTERLPEAVQWNSWYEQGLGELIAEVGGSSDGVIVIQGNTSYDPKLLNGAFKWDGAGCVAGSSSSEPAGLCVLSQTSAASLDPCVQSFDQLQCWASAQAAFEEQQIPDEALQRVVAPNDLAKAERKLDAWLVKPTDGIFARMNRKISTPISRQMVKLPITPNMVTLFVLGVSLTSGAFYSRGGYWNILLGAFLGLAASILDGCDGEVARIKLQSTPFGCWLDSICDYAYYVVAFGGMAVGLARQSGSRAYLAWGVALLVGAVLMFIVVSLSRQRLAGAHPEKLLAVWQKKAESRSSNPLMYFARQCEFVLRRCFLPYALLFFALVNLTKVAFIMAAVGANVAWLLALYSYLDFSRAPHSAANNAAVIRPEATA